MKRKLFTILTFLLAFFVTIGIRVQTGKCESKIHPLPLADMRMNQLCVQKGKLCAYYKDEDSINQKAVFQNNKWMTKMVKDSFSIQKGEKKYFAVFPDGDGYIEVSPDVKTIKTHNANGKVTKKIVIKNTKLLAAASKIKQAQQVGKNLIFLLFEEKKTEKNTAIMIDKKSQKIRWKKKNMGDSCQIIKNTVYAYRYTKNAKETDVIRIYEASSGKKEKYKMDLSSIRQRVEQKEGEESVTDCGFVLSENSGSLYVGYQGGIYQVKGKGTFIDIMGVNQSDFYDKQMISFAVANKKEVYALYSKGRYDGEAQQLLVIRK